MKIFFLFIILILSQSIKSQALYPGNVMLDIYGGFPNFGKMLFSSNLANAQTVSLHGLAPSGIRGEYLIDDNIGFGIDFMYNYVDFKYKTIDTTWIDDKMLFHTDDINSIMKRIRIHFRFNYHFEHDNPRFDSYFGVGAGYNNRIYNSTKNGLDNTNDFKSRIQLIPFPVSARVCLGGRYYFSQFIGLVGEVGLGGPLLSLGLALKY